MWWNPSLLMFLPGLAGLFFVRIFFEGWAISTHTAVPLWIVLLIGVLVFGGVTYLFKSVKLPKNSWPILFLLLYLFHPQISLNFALLNLTFVLLLMLGLHWQKYAWGKRPFFMAPVRCATLLATIFAILYFLTIAPDVLPADNGEFQWVASQAGVLHPPGFPLYTMLAYGINRLFFWLTPAMSMALFAILTSSSTLFFVYLIVFEESKSVWWAVTAVVALGTATTFWAQATIANIRSLTGLFTILPLFYLLRLRKTENRTFDRWLLTAVFFTALGVAHHPSLAFFALVFVIYVLWVDRTVLMHGSRLGKLVIAVLPGLLTFLYLPLRAQSGSPGTKPSLASWNGFWNHALARGFSGDFFFFLKPPIEPAVLLERFRIMGDVLLFQWSPWLLTGLVLGSIGLLWQDKKTAFLLLGSFLLHVFVTATYRAPQTVEYMLPAYVAMALILGMGVKPLLTRLFALRVMSNGRLSHLSSSILIALVTLFLAAGLAQGSQRWGSFRHLHFSSDTRETTLLLLMEAEPQSVILADWHWFTPLRYLQDADGIRPDVEVRFVAPDGPSYGETWVKRIETELANGRSVIATHFDPVAYERLPVAKPVGEAFQYLTNPNSQLPADMQGVDHNLDGVVVKGVAVREETAVIGTSFPVTIGWQSASGQQPQNIYIHVVGFDGRLYAQDDQTIVPAEQGLTLTRFWLTLKPGSQPGDFAIFVGSGSNRQMVSSVSAIAQDFKPVTQNVVMMPMQNRPETLVGYDWDQTLPNRTRLYLHWESGAGFYSTVVDDAAIAQHQLTDLVGSWGRPIGRWVAPAPDQPSHYVPFGQQMVWLGGGDLSAERPLSPNQTVVIRLKFASVQPILRDTAVSVRLIGFEPDHIQWAWWDLDDSIPAMGAIPTLKWLANSRIIAPHFVTVSENGVSGQAVGTTLRLYDAFTNRTIPILDERITEQFQWVPLSNAIIR